ncbi:MAG: PGPGW domain-containing protein, partial [Kofleriaceae bacterium]
RDHAERERWRPLLLLSRDLARAVVVFDRVSQLAQDWSAFRQDSPGHRFGNHYKRMRQQGSRAGAIVRLGLGVLLVVAGIVMLFIPGPGLLVALFGLGLLGGESKKLAGVLDRIEPVMRRWGRAAKRWWTARSMVTQDVLIAAVIVSAGVAAYGAYQWWVA